MNKPGKVFISFKVDLIKVIFVLLFCQNSFQFDLKMTDFIHRFKRLKSRAPVRDLLIINKQICIYLF